MPPHAHNLPAYPPTPAHTPHHTRTHTCSPRGSTRAQAMHWTEGFTSRLGGGVGLVGSAISCEGAPAGGDASREWRENPYVLPYAWATDKVGGGTAKGTGGARMARQCACGCVHVGGRVGRRAGCSSTSPSPPAGQPVTPSPPPHTRARTHSHPRLQAGLAVLQRAPQVLACHADAWDARFWSDAGASAAVLAAGLGLDCLLAKFQGVDWGSRGAWGCNQR